jgi:anti-sigma B factor antagonist
VSDEINARPLTLDVNLNGDVALVRLHGKLMMESTVLLHARVKKLIPGHKRIVLDLSDLTHMDSSGLGSLVGLFVSARSAGCSLELVNLSHGIQRVLSLTNLLSVFTVIGEQGMKVG